jgi:hypothetical protein
MCLGACAGVKRLSFTCLSSHISTPLWFGTQTDRVEGRSSTTTMPKNKGEFCSTQMG